MTKANSKGKQSTFGTKSKVRTKVVREVPELVKEDVDRLRSLFPNVFVEGKIDFEKLRTTLGDIVDKSPDRYIFSWAGKRNAIQILQMPTRATLIPIKEKSMNFDTTENIFIEGDNLEVLKLLYKPYFGKVKLIYIDPPYNTGNDFIYADNYADPLDSYLKITGQKSAEGNLLTTNPETSGRYHSSWLSMIYPRLFLARQLLQEDGVVILSIDDHEFHNLRRIMDEIFGEENFIGQITLQSNPRGSQASKYLAAVHEYLLIYCKNTQSFDIKGFELGEQTKSEFIYTYKDGRKYRLLGLRQRGGAWKREQRPKLYFPIYINSKNGEVQLEKSTTFSKEVLPKRPTGEDSRWKWSKEKVARSREYVVGKRINRAGQEDSWDIFHMDFLETEEGEERTAKPKTIWIDKELNYQNGRAEVKKLFNGIDLFDFPKPTYLIKKILDMFDLDGEIIMDFVAGSGTTAHAVLSKNFEDGGNRKFICVQLQEPVPEKSEAYKAGYSTISEVCKERIRRAAQQLKNGASKSSADIFDAGFKVFKLAESNYKSWKGVEEKTPEKYATEMKAYIDSLVKDWKKENVVYEVAIKEGFGLNSKVDLEKKYKDNEIWRVTDPENGQDFLLCLDDKIKPSTVKNLDISKEQMFVCRDIALDDTTAANLALTCRLKTI